MIWLLRTALLILAGLATLSIIGAIAAIPGTSAGVPGAFQTSAEPPADRGPLAPVPNDAPDAVDVAPGPGTEATTAATLMQPLPPDPALAWLEPLTYAVIALAGFAAAILVALLRIGTTLAHRTDAPVRPAVFTAS